MQRFLRRPAGPISLPSALLALGLLASAASAQIRPGDLVVVTRHSETLRFDVETGATSVLSGETFHDIAIGPDRRVYAIRNSRFTRSGILPAEIVELDARTLEASPIVTSEPFREGIALDVDAAGHILLAATVAGASEALLRIDPGSGATELLSSGGLLQGVGDVLAQRRGGILVSIPGAVVRVDPETGEQSPFASDLGVTDLLAASGGRLAQTRSGAVLVGDVSGDAVAVLDPVSGETQAELLLPPASNFQVDLAVTPSDDLLVLGLHGVQRFDFGRLRFEDLGRIGPRTRAMALMPGRRRP